MRKIILIPLMCIFLASCAANKAYTSSFAAYRNMGAKQIYQKGRYSLSKSKYDQAIKDFEALDALYPFGQYAEKGQLDIIFAYYKNADLTSAIAASDRYIHLYPRSKDTDYVYYIKGMANFYLDKSWVSSIYAKDPAERDLTSYRAAFVAFSELLESYPQSKYSDDAHNRMIYIRNTIACHELDVAKFYLQRKAYVAAANRASQIVEHYQGAPVVKDALHVMLKAYNALGLAQQAEDVKKRLNG